MFRLVNVNRRAAFEYDGSWYDLAELSGDATLADPLAAVTRHRELHALYGSCESAPKGGLVADAVLGARSRSRARSSVSDSTTETTPESQA
jgi:hypothetical protein